MSDSIPAGSAIEALVTWLPADLSLPRKPGLRDITAATPDYLAFRSLGEIVEAVKDDQLPITKRHCRAAREIAREVFEAEKGVWPRLLERAGI